MRGGRGGVEFAKMCCDSGSGSSNVRVAVTISGEGEAPARQSVGRWRYYG